MKGMESHHDHEKESTLGLMSKFVRGRRFHLLDNIDPLLSVWNQKGVNYMYTLTYMSQHISGSEQLIFLSI